MSGAAPAERPKYSRGERVVMWGASAGMMLLALSTIFPILFTVNTSLKTQREITKHGYGLATQPTFGYYETAWSSFNMATYFVNSTIVTVLGVVFVLAVSSLGGFAFAQLSFRFKRSLFMLLLSGLVIPVQVILVPLFRVIIDLHMLNSHLGLGVIYGAFFSPFGIYLMTAYYTGLPRELIEAAKVDGASIWQIYWSIVLPLGAPALVTLGILTTLHCWNDILLSLITLQDHRTLMVGIAALRGEYGADIPLTAAAVVIGAAPVILIFLIFQRKILTGITVGSVKG